MKGVIKLRGNLLELGELIPRNATEVMVLIVVANVKCQSIDRSIVGVCFLVGEYSPVFCDPPGAEGMEQQTNTQKRRKE